MDKLSLDQFQKVQKKENINGKMMVDSINTIMDSLDSSIQFSGERHRDYNGVVASTIMLSDDNGRSCGFVELRNNRLELQYFGKNEADIAVVIIEDNNNELSLNSYMNCLKDEKEISLTIGNHTIYVNNKEISIPENSNILQISQLLGEVVQENQLFHDNKKEDIRVR